MLCFSAPPASKIASSFSTERNAANVLPVPVGEMMRTLCPASMCGQAANWAGVGAANSFANQSVTTDRFSASTDETLHVTAERRQLGGVEPFRIGSNQKPRRAGVNTSLNAYETRRLTGNQTVA